jgi:hypothetical protein
VSSVAIAVANAIVLGLGGLRGPALLGLVPDRCPAR